MSVVRLPRKTCDHHRLIAAIAESGLAGAEKREIKVQFQPATFMTTSALAQLCSWGLLCKTRGCSFRFLGERKALAYPSRIDLFKHLEFDYEETFERHDESGRFIPLRLLTDRGASLAVAVEAVCDLVRQNVDGTKDFLPALRWVVQELTDNVGNHADSPTPGVLCAQLYPKKRRVEIAISDMGRGIKASLSGRYPKIWSHGDAITRAMEPGVTRDLAAGQGNGLSGSQEIIMANGGGLNIWTGNADLAFDRGRKEGFRLGPEFPGTGVFFSLRTNHPVDLRNTTLFDGTERSLHAVSRTPLANPDPEVFVREHCVHVGGREAAKPLREILEERTHAGQQDPTSVVVDFEGVELPSSSFLDEVFGRFAERHGIASYERLLDVRGASEVARGMIARVVSQRLSDTTEQSVTGTHEPPLHLREVLGRVCPARSALFVGIADSAPLEEWWAGLLGRSADAFHQLPLEPGWTDTVRPRLETLEDPVLLLPAWETNRHLDAELLAKHSSLASALISGVCELVAGGRAFYLLVPTGFVSSQREVGLRNDLWSHDVLRTLVTFSALQAGFAGIHHAIDVTLLHLASRRPQEQEHAVAMIDGTKLITTEEPSKDQAKELQRLLGVFGSGRDLGYRFVWDDPSLPLHYKSHHPQLRRHEEELQAAGGTVSLGELLESSRRGFASARQMASGKETTSHPVISGREIRSLADLSPADLEKLDLPESLASEFRLRTGDVLLGGLWARATRLNIGIVPEALAGAVARDSVYVLRFADEATRDFVLDYLQSDFAREWLESRVFGGLHIPLAKLHELPVPAPDGRITKLVRRLSRTSAELRRVADEFDDQRRDLFGIESLREQVAKCEETSMLAVTLDRAIRSLGDNSERIRLLFPLPLALSWRVMELTERPRERYDAMLQVFEATVGYLAVMLVADLSTAAAELKNVPRLLAAFHTPGRGPTLGDWMELLRQAPPSRVSEALESSPFPELRVLLSENQARSDWWLSAQALLDRRNDHAHRRGPQSDGQFQKACRDAQEELDSFFSRLTFLARYRLTLVMDCAFDELTGSRTARIKELVGDHSVVPVQEISWQREVGRGLYFGDARGDLTLCSPWMEYGECPHCGHWEVTIPEYWSKDSPGGTCYKALRTGHIHRGRPGSLARIARFVGADEPEEPTTGR